MRHDYRDYAVGLVTAAAIALIGVLSDHLLVIVLLAVVACTGLVFIAYDVGYRRGRGSLESGTRVAASPPPTLLVETGNGHPFDDTRYAANRATRRDFDELKYVLETVRTDPNPELTLADIIGPHGWVKKFRVTNQGPGAARNCRAQITSPFADIVVPTWSTEPGISVRDLAVGESDFLLVDPGNFPGQGVFGVELRVFADNLTEPDKSIFPMEFRGDSFPQLVRVNDSTPA